MKPFTYRSLSPSGHKLIVSCLGTEQTYDQILIHNSFSLQVKLSARIECESQLIIIYIVIKSHVYVNIFDVNNVLIFNS